MAKSTQRSFEPKTLEKYLPGLKILFFQYYSIKYGLCYFKLFKS